jgi:hypothetical protein
MTCREFESDLWMLLERGLDAGRRGLAAHAGSCARCADSERDYRAMLRLEKLAYREVEDATEDDTRALVASILSAQLDEIAPSGSLPS